MKSDKDKDQPAAARATTDPNVGKGEEGMSAARRQAQSDALDAAVIGADDEHIELQRKREERGSQIRGTGDMPAPVHGATRPVETSSAGIDQADYDREVDAYRRDRGAAMKVRAKKLGYYGDIRRRTGDVFVIHGDDAFSENWMEPVDGRTPERTTTGRQHLNARHDEILSGRSPGASGKATGNQNVLED